MYRSLHKLEAEQNSELEWLHWEAWNPYWSIERPGAEIPHKLCSKASSLDLSLSHLISWEQAKQQEAFDLRTIYEIINNKLSSIVYIDKLDNML